MEVGANKKEKNCLNSSSDDSSADEEEMARLKEALVGSFCEKLDNAETCDNLQKGTKISSKESLKKSRRDYFNDDIIQDDLLEATPEFKAYLSKQLSKHLDSIIDDVDYQNYDGTKAAAKFTKNESIVGIRLLASSQGILVGTTEKVEAKTKKTKKCSSSSSSDSEEDSRLAEAAVSADYVIANSSDLLNKKTSCIEDVIMNDDKQKDTIKRKKTKKKIKRERHSESSESVDENSKEKRTGMSELINATKNIVKDKQLGNERKKRKKPR